MFNISESEIRSLTTGQSFTRGEDYYHTGAVSEVVQRGSQISAEVEGSSYEPYAINIQLNDSGELVSANCTCPYDWGGYCKHIIATLLTCLLSPEKLVTRPPINDLLAGLQADEVRDLLTEILTTHPHLISWVEQAIAVKQTPPARTSTADAAQTTLTKAPPIDAAPFRRRAEDVMRSLSHMRPSEAYWHTGDLVSQMSALFGQAQPYLDQNDGPNALRILEALTQVYLNRWLDYDDSNGELGGFFEEIGEYFAEALLSGEFSPSERQTWASKLTQWQAEIDDYGLEGSFELAIIAAELGWDYAPLQATMGGHITEKGAWEDEAPWYADELAVIRLRVLERQGRTTEYLNLAEAEGQTAAYLTMLAKLDRHQEAVDYALKYAATADECLALAQALRQDDHPNQALQVAEHGLTLYGHTGQLSQWLRETAAELGNPKLALQAARAAFSTAASLENYLAVEKISGADWPQIKQALLQQVRDSHSYDKVDIYLHEGLIDEAVQAVDRGSLVGYDGLRRVVDAAISSHPDWVIRQATGQAKTIMDRGQSKYYHHAADWLERARKAYLAANRSDDWRTYLESLITKHARKYSLRPRLEALRLK